MHLDDWTLDGSTYNSTNCTEDNIPGTGRTLDTYVYQVVGRLIERCLGRIVMKWLHPGSIADAIMNMWGKTQPLTDFFSIVRLTTSDFNLACLISSARQKKHWKALVNLFSQLLSQLRYVKSSHQLDSAQIIKPQRSVPNQFHRLSTLVNIIRIGTEDLYIYAYILKVAKVTQIFEKKDHDAVDTDHDLIQLYDAALTKLVLTIMQEDNDNEHIDAAGLSQVLLNELVSALREYRYMLSPFAYIYLISEIPII